MILSIWKFVTLSQKCKIPKNEPYQGMAMRGECSAPPSPAPRAHVTQGETSETVRNERSMRRD